MEQRLKRRKRETERIRWVEKKRRRRRKRDVRKDE